MGQVFKNLQGTTSNEFYIGKTNTVGLRYDGGVAEYNVNEGDWFPFVPYLGNLSSDPTGGTAGQVYYNTSIDKLMTYDGLRSKWLSQETVTVQVGRNGTTTAGVYYRGVNGMTLSSTRGYPAFYDGTVIGFGYTRADSDSATFSVMASGVEIATVSSSATLGGDYELNANISRGNVLAAMNKSGSNSTSYVQAWMLVKWRDT